MTIVAGVDGCPKGCIAIVLDGGCFARAEFATTFADLLPNLADAEVIAVDIPIGLPEGPDHRPADVEAKTLHGKFAPRVFMTPPRAVLETSLYAKANSFSKSRFKRGISTQSYALRKKIFEVDAVAVNDDRIYEVHPEVSFCAMKGEPLDFAKKSWNEQMERRALLATQGIVLPHQLDETAGKVPPDDLLDAAAAASTADRCANGEGQTLPASGSESPTARRGLIWY